MAEVKPAVWHRMPDIPPNYASLERRRAKSNAHPLHSRLASVIMRDNRSEAQQLSLRLTSLDLEQTHAVRLLETGRQSFIAHQMLKQKGLEKRGITEVSLLPPHLIITDPTSPKSPAEVTSLKHGQTTDRPKTIDLGFQGHGRCPPMIVEDIESSRNDVVDYKEQTFMRPSICTQPSRIPRAINSASGIGMTSSKGGESPMTSMGKSKTTLGTSFLTHNYTRTSSAGAQVEHGVEKRLPNMATSCGCDSVAVSNDPRFVSLVTTLSQCVRCPPGADTFIQLSPSGSQVLAAYATPMCDLEAIRRAIDACEGTARLRYVRPAAARYGPSAGQRLRRPRYLGRRGDDPPGRTNSVTGASSRTQCWNEQPSIVS